MKQTLKNIKLSEIGHVYISYPLEDVDNVDNVDKTNYKRDL